MKRACVITDNQYIYEEFQKLICEKCLKCEFEFYFSASNVEFQEKYIGIKNFKPIKLSEMDIDFFNRFDVFFSLHSKQIFPDKLVNEYRCVNIHPGFNPYNRGWYPQVFSILNQKPTGVTIHEMDTKLDHGPIIAQKEVEVYSFDTSYDVYQRILKMEIDMLREYLENLVSGEYKTEAMKCEGNINYKQDFERICKLDLESYGTLKEHIDLLRATTFKGHKNAYFIDKEDRIYVSIVLETRGGNKREYRGIYQKSYSLKSALLKGRFTNLLIRKECVE